MKFNKGELMKRLTPEIKEFILRAHDSYSIIIEEVKKRFSRKVAKSTIGYYRGKKCGRVKTLNFSKLKNVEFAYLGGLFLADGCAYSDSKGSYSVIFSFSTQNDRDIIKYITSLLMKIDARPSVRVDEGETQVRVFSKELYHAISHFRQLDFVRSFLREHTLIEKLAFAGGLVDGDGHVLRRRKNISIEFFQFKHNWVIPLFFDFFRELLGPDSASIWKGGCNVHIRTSGVKTLLAHNLIFCLKLSRIAGREFLLIQTHLDKTHGAGEEIRTPESPAATGSLSLALKFSSGFAAPAL